MFSFIESAEGITRIYAYIALFGTTIFVLFNFLSIIGIADNFDFELDFELDLDFLETPFMPFKLLTLRGLVAGIMFFGWAGYLTNSIFYALLFGFLAIISISLVYYLSGKLQHKGNFMLEDAIGSNAKVYLRITGDMKTPGKVFVELSNSINELNAISADDLNYNDEVVVVGVKEGSLIVKKIEEEN